eukprot:3407118-Amphidinium_carterae.1
MSLVTPHCNVAACCAKCTLIHSSRETLQPNPTERDKDYHSSTRDEVNEPKGSYLSARYIC